MNYSYCLAAVVLVICAGVHSIVGERLLIIPLLKRELPPFFGSVPLARRTLRMAWHILTVVWLGMAALLVLAANPLADLRAGVPIVLAGVCLTMAALSLAVTRGAHLLSWMGSLTVAGLILFGAYFSRV
jgi:hypothetical protein